ncbi:AraC family transcriptional regulator [Myceligenerans indicum]|uniref:AraC family transcriptional regulator n=1 Tax=Myceligenerans indicum TaxID=2593663 RepID=A0ABS1LG93_9MICO|nr:AraC family transcriptional regulator [Myceligenerans indicum]MBL0885256.1 AraC family transcriptional regulator [Myceligenerans indicum]
MDLISRAIESVRAGRANGRRLTGFGPWGMRFPAFVGIGFHIVLSGEAWLLAEDARPVLLRPGDIAVAPNGAAHGLARSPARLHDLPTFTRTDPPGNGQPEAELLCGAYRLEHGTLHPFLRDMPDLVVISPEHADDPDLASVTRLLEDDVAHAHDGNWVTRSALVDLVLVRALRQWQEGPDSNGAVRVTDPAITAVLDDIHERPEHPWTVQELAQASGMSRTQFNRRFAAEVGRPPMSYVTQWRLAHGARLLRQTSWPLSAIARQAGYSNEFAFASAFRREYGLAPGRFRDHPDPLPRQPLRP